MAVYPIEFIGVGSSFENIIPINRTGFENNTVSTRRACTKKRASFEINHPDLSFEEFETLNEFFDDNQGTLFEFTHPITNITYNVKFGMDRLKFSMNTTYVSVSGIIIEEQ